nr:MAG TPA: hypothetical protein [Bacteriophage sp.]
MQDTLILNARRYFACCVLGLSCSYSLRNG